MNKAIICATIALLLGVSSCIKLDKDFTNHEDYGQNTNEVLPDDSVFNTSSEQIMNTKQTTPIPEPMEDIEVRNIMMDLSNEMIIQQAQTGREELSKVYNYFFRDCILDGEVMLNLVEKRFGDAKCVELGSEPPRLLFSQGFEVDTLSFTDFEDRPFGNRVYISQYCTLPVNESGVRIGSTRDEVYDVYRNVINTYQSTEELIVIGIYGTRQDEIAGFNDVGVYFVMHNDVVMSMYFGDGWSGAAYRSGFYPDREIGVPLTEHVINEQPTGENGLFYLGQEKTDVMVILATHNIEWSEHKDNRDCVVIADEFIFIFDNSNTLISVAVDGEISNRSCVRTTTLGLSVGLPIQRVFDRYGHEFDKVLVKEEEFLGKQGYTYIKYTYDTGKHSFFVCTTNIQGIESIIRWGIEVKRP